MKPQLSIIVPLYNVEKYISDCLESLLSQDSPSYEIIIINDGSTDRSADIAKTFQDRSETIAMYHQENKGLSSARNQGLRYAKGEYIWFVDSDDRIEPGCIRYLLERIREYDLNVLSFNAFNFGQGKEFRLRRKDLVLGDRVFNGPELWELLIRKKAYLQTVWTNLYKKEFLETNGIHFREGLYHEDELYSVQVMAHAKRIQCIDEPFYYYRHRQDSIVGRGITEKHIHDTFFILHELRQFKLRYPGIAHLIDYRRYSMVRSLNARLRDKDSRKLYFSLSGETPPLADIGYNRLFSLRTFLEIQAIKYFRRLYLGIYLRGILKNEK